jgi:hypothetical protein
LIWKVPRKDSSDCDHTLLISSFPPPTFSAILFRADKVKDPMKKWTLSQGTTKLKCSHFPFPQFSFPIFHPPSKVDAPVGTRRVTELRSNHQTCLLSEDFWVNGENSNCEYAGLEENSVDWNRPGVVPANSRWEINSFVHQSSDMRSEPEKCQKSKTNHRNWSQTRRKFSEIANHIGENVEKVCQESPQR